MKKFLAAVALTVLIALSLGVAFCQRAALKQTDAMTWHRTFSAAGLGWASPSQIVSYLSQHGLTHIAIRGPRSGDPIPGYSVVTARIAPIIVVGPMRLSWGEPHALSLYFCNGRLYAEAVGPWA